VTYASESLQNFRKRDWCEGTRFGGKWPC